jgi:hypothetical protein
MVKKQRRNVAYPQSYPQYFFLKRNPTRRPTRPIAGLQCWGSFHAIEPFVLI